MNGTMRILAWTGGDRPRPWRLTPHAERQLVRHVFRESMTIIRDYWDDYRGPCASTLEAARLHWKRARYDVYATLR